MILFFKSLQLSILLGFLIPVMAQEPKIVWFDDFLGIKLNPTYALSLSGTGNVKISEGPGGIVALYTTTLGPGGSRMRLGEEPGNSPFNATNFNGRQNLRYKARVFVNRNSDVQVTVGLTGLNDPKNVLALVFNQHDSSGKWDFEVINEEHRMLAPTDFLHESGRYFTVRIETEFGEGECRCAKAYINDQLKATVAEEFIPSGLVAEFQAWNRAIENGYSQITLYVDYLSIVQDRN